MATISLNRRPIRDDAERKNEFTCRISPIPSAPWEPAFRCAWKENGRAPAVSRGCGENSNGAIAGALVHDGFIAAIRAATMEFFSLEKPIRRAPSVSPA